MYRRFRYAPEKTGNLSHALSALSRISEGVSMDLEMDGSGECGSIIWRGACSHAQRAAKKFGFRDVERVLSVAEKRTNPQFMYKHLSHLAIVP